MATKKTTKKPQSWFVQKLIKMGACSAAIRYAKKHRTFPAAWNSCDSDHWMCWLLREVLTNGDCRCGSANGGVAEIRRRFTADRVAKALRDYK